MASPQLRLVTDPPPGFSALNTDATRRIFEHWLYMTGASPARCKLGPTRRAAINAALAMGYDEDMVLQAVEGMASDPLDDCTERMRDTMRGLEWLLGKEAYIERWAARGLKLRRAVARQAQPAEPLATAEPQKVVDPAIAAAARERLRQMAASLRGAADDA